MRRGSARDSGTPTWSAGPKVERYRRAGGSFQGTGQVPVAVVAFQEAWAAPPRDGDQRRPADHPDRYEVIVIGGGALGWREGEGVYQAHRMAGVLNLSRDQQGRLVVG